MSLHTWHHQGSCDQSSCTTFKLNLYWRRAATGRKKKKKSLASIHPACFSRVQLCVTLWAVTCQVSLSGAFSRQEYWIVLVNVHCHTLLEHCISCFPSCQLPWVPSAARTLQPKQLHNLHIWSSLGQTHVLQRRLIENCSGWHTCRGGNKATDETQGSVAKEEDPNTSHQLYKMQVKSTWSTR